MNSKKLELIYDEEKIPGWCLGYSIGTVYKRSIRDNLIELWNFGYNIFDKEFYYTKRVHLLREISDYFNDAEYNEENIAKMEALGIYNGDSVDTLIDTYEKAKKDAIAQKIEMRIERQKVLEFRSTLKKGKKGN